jgi:hypothetical protein
MLKKVINVFLTLLIFFNLFFINISVFAETPSIESTTGITEIPGVTCGDGSNERISRCCKNINSNDLNAQSPRFFCLFGACLSSVTNSALNAYVKPKLNEITENSIEIINENSGCVVGEPNDPDSENCTCIASPLENLCVRFINNIDEKTRCDECVRSNGMWTAIGCIGLTYETFISSLLSISLGLAGGIAFLCIIFSAIMFQTSSGNPERIKKARMYLTNCIVGLLLIIFSVFILKLIGFTILRIPNFT